MDIKVKLCVVYKKEIQMCENFVLFFAIGRVMPWKIRENKIK